MEREDLIRLLGIICFYFFAMFFAAISTSSTLNENWYDLLRPAFTTPSLIFPLFFLIVGIFTCFSLNLSWKLAAGYHRKLLVYIYIQNLIFSTLWIFVYFGLKDIHLAFADSLLILATTVFIMKLNKDLSKTASALMIPYIVWYFIIAMLNYMQIFYK